MHRDRRGLFDNRPLPELGGIGMQQACECWAGSRGRGSGISSSFFAHVLPESGMKTLSRHGRTAAAVMAPIAPQRISLPAPPAGCRPIPTRQPQFPTHQKTRADIPRAPERVPTPARSSVQWRPKSFPLPASLRRKEIRPMPPVPSAGQRRAGPSLQKPEARRLAPAFRA